MPVYISLAMVSLMQHIAANLVNLFAVRQLAGQSVKTAVPSANVDVDDDIMEAIVGKYQLVASFFNSVAIV